MDLSIKKVVVFEMKPSLSTRGFGTSAFRFHFGKYNTYHSGFIEITDHWSASLYLQGGGGTRVVVGDGRWPDIRSGL